MGGLLLHRWGTTGVEHRLHRQQTEKKYVTVCLPAAHAFPDLKNAARGCAGGGGGDRSQSVQHTVHSTRARHTVHSRVQHTVHSTRARHTVHSRAQHTVHSRVQHTVHSTRAQRTMCSATTHRRRNAQRTVHRAQHTGHSSAQHMVHGTRGHRARRAVRRAQVDPYPCARAAKPLCFLWGFQCPRPPPPDEFSPWGARRVGGGSLGSGAPAVR